MNILNILFFLQILVQNIQYIILYARSYSIYLFIYFRSIEYIITTTWQTQNNI